MYSTIKNIVTAPPTLHPGHVCGKYLLYPASIFPRREFGIRLQGKYKSNRPNLPLVSIVTVTLNRNNTIERCLLSVLNQTYENIEYIVIDGGSTDGTLEVIEKCSNYIDYCVSERDTGIYNAINKGISLATGNYILVLNSDDSYTNTAVSDLVNNALRTKSDVTHANAYTVSDEGSVTGVLKGWLHKGFYTRGMPIRHETMLVNNSVYNNFGYYNENYLILSDFIYLVDLYAGNCTFSHINKTLLYFSLHGASNVDNDIRYNERARFYRDIFPFLDQADIDLMKKKGRLGIFERIGLIRKYWRRNDSKLFIESMVVNLCYSLIDFKQLASLLLRLVKSTWFSISRFITVNK